MGKSETDNTTLIDCHGKNGKLIQIINVSKNSCTSITVENSGKCEYTWISVLPKVISTNYFTYITQKTAEYVSYAQ